MFKKIGLIFWNRVKFGLMDLLADALYGTIQEYRRANRDGVFDTHQNQTNNNNQINH